MSRGVPVTIINVGYRSTNYWVVSAGTSRLLVDIGWPGTLGTMKANLKRMGAPLREIRYALATHYHPEPGAPGPAGNRRGNPSYTRSLRSLCLARARRWFSLHG